MSKREELRDFVEDDDRDGTPIFAGREREIGAVARDLRRRLKKWRGGDLAAFKSATRLFQGAPGAGKTALLEHLAERLTGASAEGDKVEGLRVCWLDSEELGNRAYRQDELARAFDAQAWAALHSTTERSFRGGAGGGVEGVQAQLSGGYSTGKSAGDVSKWQTFKHAIKARWTDELVARSDGWPKHLHCELQALGASLLDFGLDLGALERAGERAKTRIAGESISRRDYYYSRRINSKWLRGKRALAAEGAQRIGPGADTVARLGREIAQLAAERGPDDAEMELPPGMSGEGFVGAMIRAGVLHKDSLSGEVSVPIPSLLTYLEPKFGEPKPARSKDGSSPDMGM